jgi:hypothetical protein
MTKVVGRGEEIWLALNLEACHLRQWIQHFSAHSTLQNQITTLSSITLDLLKGFH